MNSFGRIFRISIFGESHNKCVGITIDGIPPGIELKEEDFFEELKRRKAGTSGTTSRVEDEIPILVSGLFNGKTTGTPLNIYFENKRQNSSDYLPNIYDKPRPGHIDFISLHKYFGFADYRGSGHFSGRLTVALVAAGVVARKIFPIEIETKALEIGGVQNYLEKLNETVRNGDSLGGITETIIKNVPIGLGEPFFDSVESLISHIIFSIPGTKGIEFGAGFKSAKMYGSEYADSIIDKSGKTMTNNSGGVIGGVTNGNEITFKVAFHPPVSIRKKLKTYNFKKHEIEEIQTFGAHDVCYVLRVPPIIDACVSIVLTDLYLIRKTQSL